ncbi:hypothetical protein F5876DRAFT_78189 [Lentinula aff. lateritia]|uniref:Uncharacterized protein n=1 Tax=Lentinula aff. lateritia TaxID=2804960 RepID=A0ACC1TW85_9AGAR|nr:hypothetical protein F5876DRAFT_78189 [Lentinula aff. lateritia]
MSSVSSTSSSELFLSHKAPLDHSWSSAKCFPGSSAFFDSAGSFSGPGLLSSTSWDNALDLPSLNRLETVHDDYARSCTPSDLDYAILRTFGDNVIAGRPDSRDTYWPSSVLPQSSQQGLATDMLVSSFDPLHPMIFQQSQSAFSGHISNVSGYPDFDRFSSLKKVLDLDNWHSFGHHPSSFRSPDHQVPRSLLPASCTTFESYCMLCTDHVLFQNALVRIVKYHHR